MKDLQLIITGGTIDSEWDPLKEPDATCPGGRITPRSKSGIKSYIKRYLQPDFLIHENIVALIDSRDMTDEIMQQVFEGIKASKSNNIIITHGTDTLAETARALQQMCARVTNKTEAKKLCDKKVVLLGSFFPLVGGTPTDAPYNLGFAIAMMDHIAPGVYIAMNSRVFTPFTVKKDFEKGKFVNEK